ncbi:lipoprotein [Phenylobacterium sp.]|jgi:hypothetical protein|uniref:lipoprotein n=1 Tax=Phenylobacterium sp. TaxID=1871053 RepID=UPI0037849084
MRKIIPVLGLALALAACNQTQQDKAQANANEAASEVKENSIEVGREMEANLDKAGQELKEITSDPDVKRAAGEAKDALKEMGSAIKDAADDDKPATTTARSENRVP